MTPASSHSIASKNHATASSNTLTSISSSASHASAPNTNVLQVSEEIKARTQHLQQMQQQILSQINDFMNISMRGGAKTQETSKLKEKSRDNGSFSPNQLRKCMRDIAKTRHKWNDMAKKYSKKEKWQKIQQNSIDFDALARKEVGRFLREMGGTDNFGETAPVPEVEEALHSLMPPAVTEDEFQEYCALEIEEIMPISEQENAQGSGPHTVHSPQPQEDMQTFDDQFELPPLPDDSTPRDNDTVQDYAGPLLQAVGIDLDELMKDFDPDQLKEHDDNVQHNLKELKDLSKKGTTKKKSKDTMENHSTFIDLLSTPALSKYTDTGKKTQKKATKKRAFKLKKHASDNMLQAPKQNAISAPLPIATAKGKKLTENIMQRIMNNKSFDVAFLFGENVQLSEVRKEVNINKRVNMNWNISLPAVDLDSMDDALNFGTPMSGGSTREVPSAEELVEHFVVPPDTDCMSDDERTVMEEIDYDTALPDDLPTPYQDTSAPERTSPQPQKRRRVEMIRSLMDRVKHSNRSFFLPNMKPFIDRYLRDRISGQSAVTIRFSSIMNHLRSQLQGICHTVDRDILLRRVIVALLFSVHEYNAEHNDQQFRIIITGGQLAGDCAVLDNDETCVIQYS